MIELFLLGAALAMDSMAVSIVNGIKYRNYGYRQMFAASFSFGFFQGLMPLLGYLAFTPFLSYIERYDHWVVLIALSVIGIGMIRESFDKEAIEEKSSQFSTKILLTESIATAIDALSSGIILPEFPVSPLFSCFVIFIVTFLICMIAHRLGKRIALLLKDKATMAGGIILILIGVKTVLEHLGFI
ncbi:MAG: manganese efflux pump MntP family protein [Erysipelotrichaceae bacterium]|jgi:putative Mn2+ efflux pump MntP|nr:manganese efflux pump MntP family protein [Erysipelotrichaceae bacterium]